MSRIKPLLALVLCLIGTHAEAQQGGDLEAQILYAFHAEDANQLASLVQTLSTQEQSGGADATLHYHLAHAEYRMGLVTDAHGHKSQTAFSACIDELKPLVDQDGDPAEALALQGACYADLARHERLERLLLRSRAEDRSNRALKLAPRNPRVVYLAAKDGLERSKLGSKDYLLAFGRLQLAVQLFEQSSATSVEVPGWGHAEAYLDLGRQLQSRGDVLGARNWIEKALIIAPNFKAAQRQMATLIRR